MGIPKFFRWISERYPLCSQLIQENHIPEFDNLYLDMNGIIHNCSHPNDNDVHFRMTEDKIFLAIFSYIDHIFTRIKPRKLFFLAVDGVAPRAKMNQQRARRFRTARDTAEQRKRAIAKGEELPKEAPFDSNCITPGTPFMVRLQEQLKYFINKKISEDSAWNSVEVILSGHEVPGEGEHKIMEYLRLAKSQPNYEPNVRHCLYGLDADLMMLGLLSHEPHFALLREEVSFGKSRKTSVGANLETQNFYLMHLSLFREYIDAEFSSLAENLAFKYDLERIIDDFILMAYFVGNDFLPSLPGLHINEGALALLFRLYKQMLLEGGGYLNDAGKLHLGRCEIFLRKLGDHERELFGIEVGDVKWLRGKNAERQAPPSRKNSIVLSKQQSDIYDQIKTFVLAPRDNGRLTFPASLPARDRAFIIRLSTELGINHTIDAIGKGKGLPEHHIILEWDDEDDEDDEESMEARQRVLKRWDKAEVIDEDEIAANLEREEKQKVDDAFVQWKREYYKEKLEINYDDPKQMAEFVYHYVEGLQWVAYYYYNGVASWEWFYPYHYGPKITDLVNIANLDIKFDIGTPFRPFDQLMGVLPAASKQHIPEAFQGLMTDPTSPIIDFYPTDFELDMNGKKADWEAVVKIPFIDEKRLLAALGARENQLTREEKSRNTHGHSYAFTLDSANAHLYPSSLPGFFPDLTSCVCKMRVYNLPTIGGEGFVKGLTSGVQLGVRALPGFPSMHTLPHTATLGFHGVKVFNMESPNESVLISIENAFEGKSPEEIAKRLIGNRIHYGWPFLVEAYVSFIEDEYFKYELQKSGKRVDVVKTPQAPEAQDRFYKAIERVEGYYSKRFGTITGPIDIILHVRSFKGMRLQEDGALVKDFAPFSEEQAVALQTIVESVEVEDPRYAEQPAPALDVDYPLGASVFFLGLQQYGNVAEVSGYGDEKLNIKLNKLIDDEFLKELHFTRRRAMEAESGERYAPSWQVAKSIGMSSLALSKVTSSLHVISKASDQRYNVGLNLKFESKKQKVLGYTRKTSTGWEYSQKAVKLISDYKAQFPAFFDGIEQRSKADFYQDTDFFPPQSASEKMTQIKEWLKNAGVKDLEKVALETMALTKDVVLDLERQVGETYKAAEPLQYKQVIVKNVPRPAVLKAAHARHRLNHQKFDLGDRVISVVDSGSVPLGSYGTVVGLEGSFLDVLFDKAFLGGTTLGGRCKESCGLSVHRESLLNLTHIQPPIKGTHPVHVIPAFKPVAKFAMKSGGLVAAQQHQQHQREEWMHKKGFDAPPTDSAWTNPQRKNDAVYNGPRHQNSYQNANQPQQRQHQPDYQRPNGVRGFEPRQQPAGKRDAHVHLGDTKQKYASKSGVQIEITKRSQKPAENTTVAPVAAANDTRQAPTKASKKQVANTKPVPNEKLAGTGQSANVQPAPPQTSAPAPAPSQPQYAQQQSVPVKDRAAHQRIPSQEEQLTQSLRNMLHIGGNANPQPQQHFAPPERVYPQYSQHYGPPHGGGYPPQHYQPYSAQRPGFAPYVPPPQQPPQQPPVQEAPVVEQQLDEVSALDVSRQLMAMLQPARAHRPTASPGGGFNPYQVASTSNPISQASNELATLVQHKGAGGHRGRAASHQPNKNAVPGNRRGSQPNTEEATAAAAQNITQNNGAEGDQAGPDASEAHFQQVQNTGGPQFQGRGRGRGNSVNRGYSNQYGRGGRGYHQQGQHQSYQQGSYGGQQQYQNGGNYRGGYGRPYGQAQHRGAHVYDQGRGRGGKTYQNNGGGGGGGGPAGAEAPGQI
ncbi:XRN 5'-3' exonuclease N-terminus-domain-containing protein [Fimicolochytrium jonesii]|uniref:XRN 5'-3' exonuclease N-terminus-domain-containing protein n=1 Tax=Fimicolochytrium jonesii TaxID=1396493 RepID=UPI0022FE4FE4|nr:XRN 5'-3' exonuclease N-terminus-domain-containing protein [Fimicolochytrium jonesii]KAI8818381.1 XRN 5'-3' exonuclease N-terminus-domain-containing protein [Fimicolochytrium jonesii]